jgi:GTPase KRas
MQVEILDTAGQDEYTPLRETFMHTGDGFLLVYSIVDDQTLEELRSIREQILRVHKDRKVPMVVIGNKADMAKKDRAVSKEEGKALADEFNASFLEVSVRIRQLLLLLMFCFVLWSCCIFCIYESRPKKTLK